VRELTLGLMVDIIMEHGIRIKCMVTAICIGQMEVGTKGSFVRIKDKDKEFFNGQMVNNILEVGKTISNMDLVK